MTITDRSSITFDAPDIAATPGVLDVGDGVGRLLGDRALYAQVLARFRDDYRHCAAALRAAIGDGDLEKAERLAHSLKGAAGLIGASSLYLQASLLELGVRNRAPGQDAAVISVQAAMEEVLQAIGRALDGATPPDAATAPRPGQADRAVVAQLAGLLDRGDGDALDLLEAAGASLAAALGQAAFEELAQAARRFDFEAALDVLRRVAQEPDQA